MIWIVLVLLLIDKFVDIIILSSNRFHLIIGRKPSVKSTCFANDDVFRSDKLFRYKKQFHDKTERTQHSVTGVLLPSEWLMNNYQCEYIKRALEM